MMCTQKCRKSQYDFLHFLTSSETGKYCCMVFVCPQEKNERGAGQERAVEEHGVIKEKY